MAVDIETVRGIASLARVKVEDAQAEALVGELNNILAWVEQLGELDTEGVEPMTSVVEMSLPMRDDLVDDGDCPDKVTANAPESAKNFFVVPRVVE